MDVENDVMYDFVSPSGVFTLTFDDDGKVAYAYLKRGNTIVGDVWIYNRCPAPEQSEWKDRTKLPFANCKTFVKEEGCFDKPVALDEISVKWDYADKQPKAQVYLFGDLAAVVGVGDKPGYSRFASKDGPLAKVLTMDSAS